MSLVRGFDRSRLVIHQMLDKFVQVEDLVRSWVLTLFGSQTSKIPAEWMDVLYDMIEEKCELDARSKGSCRHIYSMRRQQ